MIVPVIKTGISVVGVAAGRFCSKSTYKHLVFEACCSGMKDAWGKGFTGFGEYDVCPQETCSVCIYSCSPYPEGAVYDPCPISFCPFCGEAIEVQVQESGNVTEIKENHAI